jgi:hypothetical protein
LSSDFGPNNKRKRKGTKKQLEEKGEKIKLKITNKKCLYAVAVDFGCGCCSENGEEKEEERT